MPFFRFDGIGGDFDGTLTEKQKGNPKNEHQPIHNQITGSHREGPGNSAKPPEPDRGELPPAEGYDIE